MSLKPEDAEMLKQWMDEHNSQPVCTCATDPSECVYHGGMLEEFKIKRTKKGIREVHGKRKKGQTRTK